MIGYSGCRHGWMHHPGAPHDYGPYSFWPMPYAYPAPFPICPACHQPHHLCHCTPRLKIILPQEALVDAGSSPKEVLIGGLRSAKATLEYMPDEGAAAPTIEVTITDSGSTFTWKEDPVAAGYHVKSDLPELAPGAKVRVDVVEVMARLRWFEVVEYES